jgi:hypothetical protein
MKKLALSVILLGALSHAYGGPVQQKQRLQPAAPNGTVRPALRRSLVEDAIFRFYIKQFQQDADISSEVLGKIVPFLDQFLHDRFEISQRHNRALNQLRQALRNNSSDEDYRRLVKEIDSADADFQANHERFLNNVDPLLNLKQQAKVRVLQNMADKRIQQMLDEVQNPPAQRPNPANSTP